MAQQTQDQCPIAAMVTQDIQARSAVGLRKYGVTLGRTDLTRKQWLQHAYEEALDLACYLRRLIEAETAPDPLAILRRIHAMTFEPNAELLSVRDVIDDARLWKED